jgi:putative methyltransferase (TIGR04325 family)
MHSTPKLQLGERGWHHWEIMSLRSRLRHFASTSLTRLTSPLEGEFRSFEEAADAAQRSTYESGALIDLIAAKTGPYRERVLGGSEQLNLTEAEVHFGLALHLASRGRSSLTVIDFGGACGTHYYLAKRLLGPTVSLSWRVVETPAMTTVARSRFENAELAFFDSLTAATRDTSGIELLHSANALQYLPAPADMLSELLNVGARWLAFTSIATCARTQQFFFLQRSALSSNGPGRVPAGFRDCIIHYPFTPLPEEAFIASTRMRYRMELCMDESRYFYHKACGRISYRSYVLSSLAQAI